MTSFVYDFKDIASRMKGELKPCEEPKIELMPPLPSWTKIPIFCNHCKGIGQDIYGRKCLPCDGNGVIP